MTAEASKRADYGLDAPGTVRNLLLAGAAGLTVGVCALLQWIPPGLVGVGFAMGATFTVTGLWMIYTSKIGKVHARERLLDRITWTGAEQVLDVGCGRGLMLIGAAKRLTTGRATGIDIWQTEDLSGNRPEATLENARREGVTARVEVTTSDMRKTPFGDGRFDVIVSCWAIHNLYKPAERAEAIREIVRVLKPGGTALIKDIRHIDEYTQEFEVSGCKVTRLTCYAATCVKRRPPSPGCTPSRSTTTSSPPWSRSSSTSAPGRTGRTRCGRWQIAKTSSERPTSFLGGFTRTASRWRA